jgi:hypothetical protein
MAELWERAPKEGDKAFLAFSRYRDMGPATRTLERVSIDLANERNTARRNYGQTAGKGSRKPPSVSRQVELWSSMHSWRDRVRAWDAEQDRIKRESMTAEIEVMGRRHAQIAMAGLQAVQVPFLAMLHKLREDPRVVEQLAKNSTEDLVKMVNSSAIWVRQLEQAEREARGVEMMLRGYLRTPVMIGAQPQNGNGTIHGDGAAMTVVRGAEFTWVQGKCICGHTHSVHDQENDDPFIVPCTISGCDCQRFVDAAEVAENGR